MEVSGPTSRPGRFIPRKSALGTHWIGGWVGPRAGLDAVVKRKNSQPLSGLEHLIIQPVAQRYTAELSRLLWKRIRYLIKHYTTEWYGGVEAQLHVFLTSAIDGGEWLASRSGRFKSGKRDTGTHWVGHRAGLDVTA
jgi:hypothetical protein